MDFSFLTLSSPATAGGNDEPLLWTSASHRLDREGGATQINQFLRCNVTEEADDEKDKEVKEKSVAVPRHFRKMIRIKVQDANDNEPFPQEDAIITVETNVLKKVRIVELNAFSTRACLLLMKLFD